MYTYKPNGVCAHRIKFELRDGKVYSVSFVNSCDGNQKAIGILVEGMDAEELVKKLRGLRCEWRNTSCPDQLAIAVLQAINQKSTLHRDPAGIESKVRDSPSA